MATAYHSELHDCDTIQLRRLGADALEADADICMVSTVHGGCKLTAAYLQTLQAKATDSSTRG